MLFMASLVKFPIRSAISMISWFIVFSVAAILFVVSAVIAPRTSLVDDHLSCAIQIVFPVPLGQCTMRDPTFSIMVSVVSVTDVIIDVQFGHIIITSVIVSLRAPCGLKANIDVHSNLGVTRMRDGHS